jgi:molybdopterin adenylyltransferase
MTAERNFIPLRLCVLTVSDTRTLAEDSSGDYFVAALTEAGHQLADRALLRDDRYQLRAKVSQWIATPRPRHCCRCWTSRCLASANSSAR